MPRVHRNYVPQTPGELLDLLGMMMLSSPTFVDKTGYFPWQNIDTVFQSLNDGLQDNRSQLGEERFKSLLKMSDQMRAYFEADPADTGVSLKGREVILDMMDLIKGQPAKS
jgi:hypothetical protein